MSTNSPQNTQARLLASIAEELKIPLLRIAREAELQKDQPGVRNLEIIEASADAALKLLDSYLMSAQLCNGQQALSLEPVSVSATMYDVAQYLSRLAKLQDCSIELDIHRGTGLVMAHPLGLRAALMGLGYSFIHALDPSIKKQRVVFMAQKTKNGIKAGVYSSEINLGSSIFQSGKQLYGVARQPIADTSHVNGAGFFVADSLFDAMASKLKVVQHHKSSGLAGLLVPSAQLTLL